MGQRFLGIDPHIAPTCTYCGAAGRRCPAPAKPPPSAGAGQSATAAGTRHVESPQQACHEACGRRRLPRSPRIGTSFRMDITMPQRTLKRHPAGAGSEGLLLDPLFADPRAAVRLPKRKQQGSEKEYGSKRSPICSNYV